MMYIASVYTYLWGFKRQLGVLGTLKMRARFTQSFKIQAAEKVLERANDVAIKDMADNLGVGHSTLAKWIALAQKTKTWTFYI